MVCLPFDEERRQGSEQDGGLLKHNLPHVVGNMVMGVGMHA